MKFLEQIEDQESRQRFSEKLQQYLETHPDQTIESFQDIGYIPYIGTYIMMAVNTVTKRDVCPLLYNQGELSMLSIREIERIYLWLIEREKHAEI